MIKGRDFFFSLLGSKYKRVYNWIKRDKKKTVTSRLSLAFNKPLCTLVPSYYKEAFECNAFLLSAGISKKVKSYFCTENSKPGFDFLACNRSSTTRETTSRSLPISGASAENFQPPCSTHMSNGPLLGKMYNSSAVNLKNLPLLLSKKSLPTE